MAEMAPNIVIREIRTEDADAARAIQSSITQSNVEIDFSQVLEEQVLVHGNVSFVAEFDGRVAGFMISYILNGGFGLEKSAWIATMGVDPKYMGRGIGVMLAEKIFEVYRDKGVTTVFTSVRWDSVDLLSFFKALGFDRSDFINLEKQLDS